MGDDKEWEVWLWWEMERGYGECRVGDEKRKRGYGRWEMMIEERERVGDEDREVNGNEG